MDAINLGAAMALLVGTFHADIRLAWPEWRYKALTFSYDDGTVHDRKLVEIFNRYGMKATFHLPSGRLCDDRHVAPEELTKLYAGHEIAGHGRNHKNLVNLPPAEQKSEVAEDCAELSRLAGYPVRGFAYPYAKSSPEAARALRENGVAYGRICTATGDFRLPDDFLFWRPTAHSRWTDLDAIARRYRDYKPWGGVVSLCYIWGHSYEFNLDSNWETIENFCRELGGKPDIWYAANLEIFRYLTAFRKLKCSMDCSRIENPTAETLFFFANGQKVKLAPGETMLLAADGKITVTPAPAVSTPTPAIPPEDRMVFFPDGSRKALVFSFDDGQKNDQRLAGLFRECGIRATFHLIGNREVADSSNLAWYDGHEIATHGLRHATATLTPNEQILHDIVLDRKVLETLSSRIVNGHAWPNGSTFGAPSCAQQRLHDAGIAYARGTSAHGTFALPDNFLCWEPTAKCVPAALPELGQRFFAEPDAGELKLCLLWGHSWEYKSEADWRNVEEFCRAAAGRRVWKASMGDVQSYLEAVRALEWADRGRMVRNPSARTVFIGKGGKLHALTPGMILRFE